MLKVSGGMSAFSLLASNDGLPQPVTARRLTDLDRVLEALARAKAVAPAPLSSVLAGADLRLPPDGTLVLITPVADPELLTLAGEWLARRLRVIALVLDASTFGGDDSGGDGELESYLASLAALGVAGHVVRRGDDLATALNQAMAGVPQHAWASEGSQ